MLEQVILVNDHDEPIGVEEKQAAHQKGSLHRAFSIVLYQPETIHAPRRFLLQQRALTKYHCAGLWTNSCCSHPRPGESLEVATSRRLQEELGMTGIQLEKKGSFVYRAALGNGLIEHEFDHVFIGAYPHEQLRPNPAEVNDYRWLSWAEIDNWYKASPQDFTPWFERVMHISQL